MFLWLVLLLSFLVLSVNGQYDTCPSGWDQYRSSCYKAYRSSKSWYDAYGICISLGGHLATIDSSDEDAFVVALTKSAGSGLYWLDLSDHGVEGTWRHFSTGKAIEYTNWNSNRASTSYNCANLYTSASYKWYMESCSTSRYYICETDLFVHEQKGSCQRINYLLDEVVTCKAQLEECNC